MLQLPVAETSGTRRSSSIGSPTSAVAPISSDITSGCPCFASTRVAMSCEATAQSGVLCDGFHTIESPQTAAIIAFHAHTAVDRKSTRLNSSHSQISYAVFCLKKKNKKTQK